MPSSSAAYGSSCRNRSCSRTPKHDPDHGAPRPRPATSSRARPGGRDTGRTPATVRRTRGESGCSAEDRDRGAASASRVRTRAPPSTTWRPPGPAGHRLGGSAPTARTAGRSRSLLGCARGQPRSCFHGDSPAKARSVARVCCWSGARSTSPARSTTSRRCRATSARSTGATRSRSCRRSVSTVEGSRSAVGSSATASQRT